MQDIRGFVYFEDKDIIQVKEAFWNFNIPGINYKFFEGLVRLKKKINMPGILIDGEVNLKNKKDYSKKTVELLRKKVGLPEKISNCDVSSAVNGEDYIMHLKKGGLKGKYIAIRLLPPYPKIGGIERVASDLGNMVHASDVLVRGVEPIIYKDTKVDKRCIDLIGDINFEKKKKGIEDYLESKKLVLEGYTLIDLL